MKMIMTVKMLAALLLGVAAWVLPYTSQAGEKITKPWVTGYLLACEQSGAAPYNFGFMEDADWEMLTHITHFSVNVSSDGSLNFNAACMESRNKRLAAIDKAHQHGIPIMLSVLADDGVNYPDVLSDLGKRAGLVSELVAAIKADGYDGVDLDLEPVIPSSKYEDFVKDLQIALKGVNKSNNSRMIVDRPLLTIATGIDVIADNVPSTLGALLAKIQDKVDQINVMGYDLSTAGEEVVWHDSALFDGDQVYPGFTARSVTSVSRGIDQFIKAGVLPSKLGLGMSLEVRIWQGGLKKGSTTEGVTAPMQQWDKIPRHWKSGTPLGSVANLMDSNYQCMKYPTTGQFNPDYTCGYLPGRYRWDDKAKVSYLSINNNDSDYDAFISYNDERSVYEKVNFAKQQNLGGIMIWQMRLDYMENKPAGQKRPIMKAIRKALRTGTGKYKPLSVVP